MKIELTENARQVLEARYLRRDLSRRVVETPRQLFERVAAAVAEGEARAGNPDGVGRWREVFFELLASLDFLPNSPTLMNAGTPHQQLSACFVLPVEDRLEAIFDTVKQMALIQRLGGGTGFSFSRLRPRGDLLHSTHGEASGPVSFMAIFDAATDNIKQGGKRRGANMGILRADHPDLLEFVRCKRDEGAFRNFNLSVGATDAFMQAAADGARYELRHPGTGRATGELDAAATLEEIARAAWETGDPGLLFLDAINRANPTPELGAIEATNPCGEVPLLPYEACNLGSINVSHVVVDGALDWAKLGALARHGLRFLDDVIEVSDHPHPEIDRLVRGNRKVGLGVMGFAELLVKLGIPYDSDAAAATGERLMRAIADAAREASVALAEERGVFPNWPQSIHARRGLRVRNATRTAVAPTGTLSIIAGTSASIEPLFALAYRRHVLGGRTLYEVNPLFRAAAAAAGLDVEAVLDAVRAQGSLAAVADAPASLQRLFVTALEIPPARHLQIQAAFQRGVDNSVSKTVNLPTEATPGDVARIFMQAWRAGLKGITVYRYGSKTSQVLEIGAAEEPYHYDHASRCDPEECRL